MDPKLVPLLSWNTALETMEKVLEEDKCYLELEKRLEKAIHDVLFRRIGSPMMLKVMVAYSEFIKDTFTEMRAKESDDQ